MEETREKPVCLGLNAELMHPLLKRFNPAVHWWMHPGLETGRIYSLLLCKCSFDNKGGASEQFINLPAVGAKEAFAARKGSSSV